MKNNRLLKSSLQLVCVGCTALGLLGSLSLSANEMKKKPLHISQYQLNEMIDEGGQAQAFEAAFDVGDRLFEHRFSARDGVGANVGNGQRFSLVPRADLDADNQWASHIPRRVTGPNAQSCNVCHSTPFGDGAGRAVMNNIRDPKHTGQISDFINRQTPHIFGIGALQRLAEEMSAELEDVRVAAIAQAQSSGQTVSLPLVAKGVDFGLLTAYPDGSLEASEVTGIDPDLLVKPVEWKGITTNIRAFVRDASHNELGMQPVEITGEGVDGDGDGVVNELSVGDITAMVIYQAAQPRPTTKEELSKLGLIKRLSVREQRRIKRGESVFIDTGCESCHRSQLTLNDPVFSEPSRHPDYRDKTFPAGQDPLAEGIDPQNSIRFDLTEDLPDNIIEHQNGTVTRLGNFEKTASGGAIVRLFGDLKRHDMGSGLAESVDEAGTGESTFLTKELWGVGSTAPYLHDGRATTLAEAIDFHGGESAASREQFNALAEADKRALIAFLKNQVLYKTRAVVGR